MEKEWKMNFVDNSATILDALEGNAIRALTACGLQAEKYAKQLVPTDTGLLKNSITFEIHGEGTDKTMYLGTNTEYAVYVECGTGIHYDGGRQTPWIYENDKGEKILTHGSKPHPYIYPAIADHAQTYRTLVNKHMKGK